MGHHAVKKLAKTGSLQLSLFDKTDIAEFNSPAYTHERLVVYYNPLMAEKRRKTRKSLLKAIEEKLDEIIGEVNRRTINPSLPRK